jgi:hypothetical protein
MVGVYISCPISSINPQGAPFLQTIVRPTLGTLEGLHAMRMP